MHNIGKYTILEELSRGAFATVFRARDTVLQRDVALKVLHPPLVADPDFIRRFETDARAAAQLEHPHIVTVYDLGQAETRYYIAMQYLPGGTLADRLKSGPLPWADAVRIVAEIAGALDFMHAHGLIHRDVKPTNILFNARGEAVLADFGLVKAVEGSSVARSSTGGVIGTPAYLAPEIWEGKPASAATDVYALACVLFEMLTGVVLFKGDTTPAVMRAHFLPHEYPAKWPEGVPSEVQALLERALSADPAVRSTSAGQFAADMRALTDHTAVEATPRATATDLTGCANCVRPKPFGSTIPVWAWGVGVLLLIIAVIGGGQLLRGATVSPSPTATTAVTKIPQSTATPTVTSAPTSIPTTTRTVTPTPTATSTAALTAILTPTATWTPTPMHTTVPARKACSFTLPTLVSPGNEATLPAGWFDAVFSWTGGTLCAGQQWVVVISGNGLYQECPAGNAGSVTCKLPDLAGTYSWAVEVHNSAGVSVTGGRIPYRTLFLVQQQPQDTEKCSETPPDCRGGTLVCENGQWVCK